MSNYSGGKYETTDDKRQDEQAGSQKQARQGGYVRSHDIYGGSYDRFDLLQGSGLHYG